MSHGGNIFSKYPDNSSEEFANPTNPQKSLLATSVQSPGSQRIQMPPDLVDYREKLGLPMVLPKRTPKKYVTLESTNKPAFPTRSLLSPHSNTVDSGALPRGTPSVQKSSILGDSVTQSGQKKPFRSIVRGPEYFRPFEYVPQGPKVKESLSPEQTTIRKRER